MQRATRDVLYFEIGPDNPPTLRVRPGEAFEVETQINAGPWLDTHPDGVALRQRLRGGNPSSGCVYVEGAEPGQVLNVHIGPISLDPVGYTRFSSRTGATPRWSAGTRVAPCQRLVEIRDGYVHWDERLRLPVAPMLGYVGVAPAKERHDNGWGGYWGGNLDVQEVCPGATVQLAVNVPGALLHLGDMHAIQGDGEICGAGGIEAGGRVRVRCELSAKPRSMHWPRLVNATHIMTVATAKPAEAAFRKALESLILWLVDEYGFTPEHAYMLLGQILEARCTQFVNPTFSYIVKAPRRYLPEPVDRPRRARL
jgi:acetamidase/formamidase